MSTTGELYDGPRVTRRCIAKVCVELANLRDYRTVNLGKLRKISINWESIRRAILDRCGFTLLEALTVALIIVILATVVMPSITAIKRRTYEQNAVLKLEPLASAEKRYYSEFGVFGYFNDLVYQRYIPEGYSTRFFYNPLRWGESVLPYIDKYSLDFFIPAGPNSVFFIIQAVPERNRFKLQTFNINLFLDGPTPDRIFQNPPVRKGLDENGEPVVIY